MESWDSICNESISHMPKSFGYPQFKGPKGNTSKKQTQGRVNLWTRTFFYSGNTNCQKTTDVHHMNRWKNTTLSNIFIKVFSAFCNFILNGPDFLAVLCLKTLISKDRFCDFTNNGEPESQGLFRASSLGICNFLIAVL